MSRLLETCCIGSMLLVGGCGSGRDASSAPAMQPAAGRVARVDTIMGSLADSSRALLMGAEHGQPPAVLLALRTSDVGTCEDLGRQARELQRWASRMNVPLVVWIEEDSTGVLDAFLRRERIRPASLIRSALPPVIQDQTVIFTPAALFVQPNGAVRGTAHPDRVSNVRARSFADELEALLPELSPARPRLPLSRPVSRRSIERMRRAADRTRNPGAAPWPLLQAGG